MEQSRVTDIRFSAAGAAECSHQTCSPRRAAAITDVLENWVIASVNQMKTRQELSDLQAIRELIERYCLALSQRRWQELGSVFHPDATWSCGPPVNAEFRTRHTIQTEIARLVQQWDFAVQMSHSMIIDLSANRATARTVIQEVARRAATPAGLMAFGIYHDELTRVGRRWAFSSRRFEFIHVGEE